MALCKRRGWGLEALWQIKRRVSGRKEGAAMRTLTAVLAALAFLLLFAATTVAAAETNYWRNPGAHPFSTLRASEMSADIRREAFRTLGIPERLVEQAVTKTAVSGEACLLADGDRFGRQLFRVANVIRFVNNIVVAFTDPSASRSAECWSITDTDGTTYEIVDPYVCHNLSLRIIPPAPPPPPDSCFRININYGRNQGARVNYETARELQFRGLWYTSDAQVMLHPDLRYAFVLVHLDLTEAELADLTSDVCFGYGDETGFHSETTYCVGVCPSGSYPNAAIVDAMRREKGVLLPDREPPGTFRLPLANCTGYLSLPVRYADRYGLYCVETERYRFTLRGFARYRSEFHLDTVTAEEGRSSLTRRKAEGDADLLNNHDGSVRILYGEHSF